MDSLPSATLSRAAIAEAASRPTMRFVAVKSVEKKNETRQLGHTAKTARTRSRPPRVGCAIGGYDGYRQSRNEPTMIHLS
jgi:hypothetical protein